MNLIFHITLSLFFFLTPRFAWSQNINPTSPSSPYTTAEEEHSDETIEQGLSSTNSTDTARALKLFDEKLAALLNNGKAVDQHVEKIVFLVTDPNPTLRSSAREVLRKNSQLLFEHNILSADKFKAISKRVYNSETALRQFVGFIASFISENEALQVLEDEYTFQLIEGLLSPNAIVNDLCSEILSKNGAKLITLNVWQAEQTRAIFNQLGIAPKEKQPHFFTIIQNNLALWAEKDFVTKSDMMKAIAVLAKQDSDSLRKFIVLLADPSITPTLVRLDFFTPELTQMFLADLNSENFQKRQIALYLMSELLQPLAQNKSFTSHDFTTLWQSVRTHLASFDDAFLLLTKNLAFLTKTKWLTRADFVTLFKIASELDIGTQKKFLGFLENQYDFLVTTDWLDAIPLGAFLFSHQHDDKMLLSQLEFIHRHSTLVTHKRILSLIEVGEVLKLLSHRNQDIFDAALQIFNLGFETWVFEQILDEKMMMTALTAQSGTGRVAKIITVFTKHFVDNQQLFDDDLLFAISDFTYSPRTQVQTAAKQFFDLAYPILIFKHRVTAKLKNNLKKSGLWQKLPV